MELAEIAKLAAQYGIGGFLAFILGRVMWMIGNRMIATIDSLGVKWEAAAEKMAARFDAHTKADVEAIGALTSQVERIEGKFDAVLDAQDRVPAGVPNFVPEQTSGQYREAQQPPQQLQLRSGQTPAVGSPTSTGYAQHKRGATHGR